MRIFIITIFILLVFNVFAKDYENLNFSYLTKSDGLSDNNVECIFKDSDGFMWFGTRNGLCRFDGYEIKVYRKDNRRESISGNRILAITEDKKGFLWIGTYKDGLNRFNKQTEVFEHFGPENGIGQRINCLKVFSDSTIWIASNTGVTRLKNVADSVQKIPFNKNYWPYSTQDILQTHNKDIYIATENDVIRKFNATTQDFEDIAYKRNPILTSNYRKRIIEDKEGIIWITASYHGLCSYNPKTGASEIYTAQNNNLSTNVLIGSMDIDEEGNLWILTEEDGINIFNPIDKSFKHIKRKIGKEGSLNSNHTYSVYFDDNRLVWVGTFDKGINIYNPYQKKFNTSLFKPNDLAILKGCSILDIFEDHKNRVWIGTDGDGLYRFEKQKEPVHYKMADASNLLTSNVITALGEDPKGNILIGTYMGGLISFNTETNKIQKYYNDADNSKPSSPHVWEIFCDSKHRVWLGLLAAGVDRFNFNEESFENYGPYSNQINKIDFNNVMVIEEDSDGDVWFGTEGKGLYILDGETNSILRIKNDSLSNFTTDGIIKCLLHDRWGNIWIGTEDNGLFKYNKKKSYFTRYNKNNGLTAGPVQSITEDIYGNIWIGTTTGLYNLNPNTQNISKYIIEDGLSSNDINADAMLKLTDTRIIIGTNNGADLISSENIELNEILPRLVFTKLTVLSQEVLPNTLVNGHIVLNKSISYANQINLNYKDKAFTLEFAALQFTLPQKCQYKYMLQGFDKDWILTLANRRMASYSNLDAGEYIFKVRASNNDGKWGDNEQSIKIIIKPPFWETFVFRALVILFFILTVYFIYKRRIEIQRQSFNKKQLEQEKKIIALENEKLELELKKLAFNILSKNKMLLEQKNRIISLSNKAKVSVKEGLQKIVDKIDEDMDEEKDWKVIEPQIDKAYNHFITHLKQKHPDLNANELRIAGYIRMNLSTKEICEFMNKTQRAVENDRYRLRKKIGLEMNDSIKDYLNNL